MKTRKILKFNEFVEPNDIGIPRYNNFINFWASTNSSLGSTYRGTSHARRFAEENKNLDEKLTIIIRNKTFGNTLNDQDKRQLYRAYKIMKEYGVSDSTLFT